MFCQHHGICVGTRLRLHTIHTDKGNANSRFGRPKALGTGLILVAVGVLRMLGCDPLYGSANVFLGARRSRNRLHIFRSRSGVVDRHGSGTAC